MKAIFLSSEPILDEHRTAIQKAFECPIFDFYGQAERVLSASTCNHSDNLHLNMETGIAELVPHPTSLNKFNIVATSLINYAMPLIRYAINDITTDVRLECSCGRKHKLIGPVESRTGDYVLTPDGTILSPRIFSRMLHKVYGIRASQVVQDDIDKITVNIVPNEIYKTQQDMWLRKQIACYVGDQMKIEIRKTNEIPLTKNGKHRFVISNISKTFWINE